MNQSWELWFTDRLTTHFCPFWGPFCPKSREREFCQIWDFCRKLANHNTIHFRSFLAKTNDSILHKSKKKTIFGPFFPKNPALSLFYVYGPLTSCKKIEKTNESILRTLHHWRTEDTFLSFFGPVCPKSRKQEFSQIWDFCRKLANHNTLRFRSFLAKTNDSILHKSKKKLFLSLFEKMRNFPKKSGSVTFLRLWSLNFMQKK